jgi:hypothetical protein
MVSGAEKTRKRLFGTKGRYFILTAFFAAFTASVILADSFRDHEAEMSVLVIPKNQVSADTLPEIVSNMERIAGTDAFRSAFFGALSEKSGAYEGLSASARWKVAEKMVSVRQEDAGSTIVVRTFSDDADDARTGVRQATLALFGSVGRYYNLKEDIDLRVIDGPTVSTRIANPFLFAVASAGLGAVVASAFFLMLFGLPGALSFFERSRRSVGTPLRTKVFEPEMPTSPFLRDAVETDRETAAAVIAEHENVFPESPVREGVAHGKKSSAPPNLPSLSEEEERFLREFSFEGSLEREEDEEVKEAIVAEGNMSIRTEAATEPVSDGCEPTEEEYKRRLNELLRG